MVMESSTKHKSPYGEYTIIVDSVGRKYRVGEDVKAITRKMLGYPIGRRLLLLGAWMSFFFGSVLEYGWGAASTTVISHYGWSLAEGFFNYTVYVLFQATICAMIFQRLREKGLISPRRALLFGGALLMVAYYLFANSFQPWIAYLGYAAIGGVGAGLGYAVGGGVVNKWFPEKKGWRLGLANGAWAYGAVPYILLYIFDFNSSNFQEILYITGLSIGIGLIIAGFLVTDPPKYWWPKDVDPIAARQAKLKSRELKVNPPAVAQWSPREMLATPIGKAQMISFTLALAASLFNVSFYAPFGAAMGFGGGIAFAVGAAGFALTDGLGRPTQGFISSLIGRRKALTIFYSFMGIGGLGVLYAGLAHLAIPWAILAVATGAVSGACFVFDWLIIADYFGENNIGKNWSIPYALKVVGGAFGGIVAAVILTLVSGGIWADVVTGAPITITPLAWSVVFWIGAAFSLIAAALVWFVEKPPTIEDYIKVRLKLHEPIPEEVASKIPQEKLQALIQKYSK
ncbi:MAG: oxalate/formate antiporter [Metallosphaera javensis (ex Sakai et al. 2022)]|nr:MAG: oxalate/formate antiporter [Metallosphaera javensis (ex Sakai et al. 2022)]